MSAPRFVAVTGASRGIGRAIATRLIEDGRRVLLVARDRGRLEALAVTADGRAEVLVADLIEDPAALGRAIRESDAIDGVVHAAGIAPHAPLELVTEEALTRAMRLHVLSPIESVQALSRSLRGRGVPGSVVLIASTLGVRPAAGMLAYSASKAAMISAARTMALELAADHVRVNVLAPGVVDTDMARELRSPDGSPPPEDPAQRDAAVKAQLEDLRRLHPLGRLGTPEDVAALARHVLDAPWMTGSVVAIDGGLLAG
ncbi:MAG: SDR family NAD(P)-dependent oxidoreductase [Sandaracinaceae bacterium]